MLTDIDAGFETTIVRLKDADIRVLIGGRGAALVYLHSAGDDGAVLPFLESLAAHYRVIRPDHPGFIHSDATAATSPAEIAADHLAVLDALGVDTFTIIGSSFGGWIGAELALLATERLDRTILVGPVGLPGDGTAPNILGLSPREVFETMYWDPSRKPANKSGVPIEEIGRIMQRNMAALKRLTPDWMSDASLQSRLAKLADSNVELVWGTEDKAIPQSYARDWVVSLGGAPLHLIPDSGHVPQVETPESFLAVTRLLPATDQRS